MPKVVENELRFSETLKQHGSLGKSTSFHSKNNYLK